MKCFDRNVCATGDVSSRTALRTASGFTLIELLVVVAIVGIISAIAYPSYVNHMRKGRRADVQSTMMEAAQYMQRYYAAHNDYNVPDGVLPAAYAQSPKTGAALYNLSLADVGSTQSYRIEATPVTTGSQASDVCGTLTLSDTGVKGQSGTGATVAQCWQ